MPEGRNWKRLAAEVVVIVASILLAFGIEAWWEDRQETRRVTGYLEALEADMTTAQVELDSARAGYDRLFEFVRAQVGVLVGDSTPDGDVVWGWSAGPTPRVPMGTLSALVETGDVNLLQSPSLRATIIDEHAALERNLDDDRMFYERGWEAHTALVTAMSAAFVEHDLPRRSQLPVELARRRPELVAAFEVYLEWVENRSRTLGQISESVSDLLDALTQQ